MASSSLRFFSATRAAAGQRRLRSAIQAATSSGVSSRTFVPRMGMGFLWDPARSTRKNNWLAPFRLRMDEDVPLETGVSVPIWLALASVPSWWIDKMTVHHVRLHRVRRAGKCAARIGALGIAGGVPVRWWGATMRKGVTTSRRRR